MRRLQTFITVSTVLFILIVVVEFHSCHLEPVGIDKIRTVCFDTEILPIFKNSCAMCHDGTKREGGGFIATDYASIMKAVKPGNAAASKVYKVLRGAYGSIMPPNNPLSQDQRMLIEIWIEQGANHTTCDTTTSIPVTPVNPGTKDTICFSQNILPMLNSSCGTTGCHDAASHRSGYVLTSYGSLMQNPGNIVPFNPSASRIYQVMQPGGEEDIMPPPPNSQITAQQLAIFSKWISQGALNSNCPPAGCDTSGTISFATKVFPVIQNNCIGCHGNAYTSMGGGVDLRAYAQVKSNADNSRNGIPVLDGAIRQYTGFSAMPKNGLKLDTCSIRKIELWIQQGKLNN
jgi:uncharacterized membrane protein